MKKIILIIFLSSFYAFAQDENTQKQSPSGGYASREVRFMSNVRASFIKPSSVGDNFLNKGNEGKLGLGLRFGIFKVYDLMMGVGGELLYYDTTDPAYGGDTDNILINSAFFEIMYKVDITDKLSIYPKLAPGYTMLNYRKTGDNGSQEGLRIGAGAFIDYKLTRVIAIFIGGEYSHTQLRVATNSAYKDFFGEVGQLNFSGGVKFTIKD